MRTSFIENIGCVEGTTKINKSSIDLIFTDPPYTKELYQEAYTNLRMIASRVLKPGGFLITYCPQYRLAEVLDIMRKGNVLYYYWVVAQLNGASTVVWSTHAVCGWKPILIMQKGPERKSPPVPFCDVVKGGRSKKYHPWEQSVREAIYLISRFALEKEWVFDPFMGSGTAVLAAKLLGRNYIGFEIDPDTYTTALSILQQSHLDLDYFDTGELLEGI